METERIERMLLQMADITLSLDRDIAEIKCALAALTAALAGQLNPADPAEGVKRIHELETLAQSADPNAEKRQRIADFADAVKLLRKHGSHEA